MSITGISEGVVLMLVSLTSLSMLGLLCLRCKKKPKIIQARNESSEYDPQTFQREGSRFAVTRSKTVTQPNQMTAENPEGCIARHSQVSQGTNGDYTVVIGDKDNFEPIYVAPLQAVYGNIDEMTGASSASNLGDYENVLTSLSNNDDDDYENSEFLKNFENLPEDEPDYVNAKQGAPADGGVLFKTK